MMADKNSKRRVSIGRITTSEARASQQTRATPQQLAAAAKRINEAYRASAR
jgi:hypothetical protein